MSGEDTKEENAEASSAAVDVIEENPASGAGERANEQSDKEEAPAEASKGRTGEDTIDVVVPDNVVGSEKNDDSHPSPKHDSARSPEIVGIRTGESSGPKAVTQVDATTAIRQPAYDVQDVAIPAIVLTSFGHPTSVGNATAAQLHAPTPADPAKFTLGRVYEDTSKFDDLPMLDAPNSWRIAGIAVWGGHVVNGIRITYERGGVLKSSREVVGYDDPPHEWEQIELRPGEEIIKIEAVISYRIEKLTFRTSQSRHGTFGRGTDGEVHELNVPADHRLVAFHGGVGGSLHTFGFWTLPLPTTFLGKDEPLPGPGIPLLAPHERPGFIDGGKGGIDAHIPIAQDDEPKGCRCTIQ